MNRIQTSLWVCMAGVFLCAQGGEVSSRRMFWAHYVPWMQPDNASFMIQKYYNFPIGIAPTGNPQADRTNEIRLAARQGFTGFSVDVVQSENGVAFDVAYAEILAAAEGTDFQVALCLDGKPSPERTAEQLIAIVKQHSTHPNFPLWNGRPVIFTYEFFSRTPEDWRIIRAKFAEAGINPWIVANVDRGYKGITRARLDEYAAAFDAFYLFSQNGISGVPVETVDQMLRTFAHDTGKLFIAPLSPGYYGAWLNGRNDFYQPHYGFDQLHRLFQFVNPAEQQWMHATTWNDHDETSLCPMLFTPANVEIIRAYRDRFFGSTPTNREPQVCLSYPREFIPGTVCRIEVMTLPSAANGKLRIKGRLRDEDGRTVCKLEQKELDPREFDRAEWLVSTGDLARHAVLVPEFVAATEDYRRSARLPALLPVNGHLQNAVNQKVTLAQFCAVKNSLKVHSIETKIEATVTFDAPVSVRRVSLWRNDRPLAVFPSESIKGALLNIECVGTSSFELSVTNGTIRQALRTFTTNGSPNFVWTSESLVSRGLRSWVKTAAQLEVGPETQIRVTSKTNEVVFSVSELLARDTVRVGSIALCVCFTDSAYFNHPALNRTEGRLKVSVCGRAILPSDIFWALYELEDGTSCWSDPIVQSGKLIQQNLLQTAVSLETPSSGGSGDKHHRELFTSPEQVPFVKAELVEKPIHPATVRGGFWRFDGSGCDAFGDMPVMVEPDWFVRDEVLGRQVLHLDGTQSLKMRLRTWPMGNTTVDCWLKPEPRKNEQTLFHRNGGSDAICIYLLPDGTVSVVRDGGGDVTCEKLLSTRPLLAGEWSRLRVVNDSRSLSIFINGEAAGTCAIEPTRSYGNCSWFIGGGAKGKDNFTGLIRDVSVKGIAERL